MTTSNDTEVFDLRYNGEPDGDFVRILTKALRGFFVAVQTTEDAQDGSSTEGYLDWDGAVALRDDPDGPAVWRIHPDQVRSIVVF